MAKDFNQAIVMGNLTRDPELRTTPTGQSVAGFAVATNRSWQDASGEKRDDVQYHEIVAWGKLGELASNYLKKGRKVLVVGRLQTRSWEAADGAKRQKTEIIATDINFVDRMSDGDGSSYSPPAESTPVSATKPIENKTEASAPAIEDMGEGDINLDDIPF